MQDRITPGTPACSTARTPVPLPTRCHCGPQGPAAPRTGVPRQHHHGVVTCTPSKELQGLAGGQLVWGSQALQRE